MSAITNTSGDHTNAEMGCLLQQLVWRLQLRVQGPTRRGAKTWVCSGCRKGVYMRTPCWLYLFGSYREKKPDFAQQCMPKDPGDGHKPLGENSGWVAGTESFTVRVVTAMCASEERQSTMWELLTAQLDTLLEPALL